MAHRILALSVAAAALAAGCATQEDVRALRRPDLPPRFVALADRGQPLFRSVAIYEILGAPEFRLFDGGAVYTTRPTRAEVNALVRDWLGDADMLAPDIGHATYLLTVEFVDLGGPSVIPFTDKLARANVRYVLSDARTGEAVFSRAYEASFQARMPGVTEEMVRAAFASGLLYGAVGEAFDDSREEGDLAGAAAIVGAAAGAGGALVGAAHDTLLWDWPVALADAAPRARDGGVRGAILGPVIAGDETNGLSNAETGAIGAAAAFFGAAPVGRAAERTDDPDTIGAFGGARRRAQAVRGMMLQNFNRFLGGLDEASLLALRRAVPCSTLNPTAEGPRDPGDERYGVAVRTRTADAVGYDCKA